MTDPRHPLERAMDEVYAAQRVASVAPSPAPAEAVLTDGEKLEGAADRLVAARVLTAVAREGRVPLELKGLKASMTRLAARVDRLNSMAAAADEKGGVLEGHLGDIGAQLGAHVDDIEFAASVLGNSGGSSGEQG